MLAVAVTFVFWSLPLFIVSTVTSGWTTIDFSSVCPFICVLLLLLLLLLHCSDGGGPVNMDDDELFHDCGSSVMVVNDGSLFKLTFLWWWVLLFLDDDDADDDDDERLFSTTVLVFERLCRWTGGDGVDIRSENSSGTSSAAGPTKLSSTGKKNKPFMTPIIMTANSNQKKCRTINSNGDMYNIIMDTNDVTVLWITGGRALWRASRMRRSLLPTDVTNPCKQKKRFFN